MTEAEEQQIERVLKAVRAILMDELVAVYLHGSAALGGLGPHSDIEAVEQLPRYQTIVALADALEVSVERLLVD